MNTAEKVRTYIHEKGLKQYVVASKVGMPHKTFNALLNGNKTFKADYLIPICIALECSPNELLGFDESNHRDPEKEGQS